MSRLLIAARSFAVGAHQAIGQRRKYTGECYTFHLHRVVETLRQFTDDEETLAAGYLHDVVEDTRVTHTDLTVTFGIQVANLVQFLTDTPPQPNMNRAERKAADRIRLSTANPAAKTIKLADLLDNTASIVAHDTSFARVYLAEKALLLPHLRGGHPELYTLVEKQLSEQTGSIA